MTKKPIKFEISHKSGQARAGLIETPHGSFKTPVFIPVGTKATVKSLTPEQVKEISDVVLANTYHLYLQPGHKLVEKAGGLHKFMNFSGPIITDSGGFQVFSLGAAYGTNLSKFAGTRDVKSSKSKKGHSLVEIDDEGVNFRSVIDGSIHRFTPEISMEIQHSLGADIFFAFDECVSPQASVEYQKKALERTHRWAQQCITYHHSKENSERQALFGVVQGGRMKDLRVESSRVLAEMDFDGYGIGGSFDKEDITTAVEWVTKNLPEDKPRHLLGIGEPEDMFEAVEKGVDMFDCVSPTRIARSGTLYTPEGKINILNSRFREDFTVIDKNCSCYTCKNYSRAYLAHLFRAKEMLASTLASIHNLYFIVNLVARMREEILEGDFAKFKEGWLQVYMNNNLN